MNKISLSPRTVEMLVGILATAMIVTGILLYALDEPTRIAAAAAAQVNADLNEAMTLYAENCSVCHGLAGEGIASTPALDREDLRSSDPDSLAKIISRGLFNTAMPAWNKTDGGPLSDYQVDTLVAFILGGDWQATQDRVVNLGLAPRVPFSAQPNPVILEQVAGLQDGAVLVQAINLYATECVACHGADGLGTGLAPALNDPLVSAKTTDELQRTILNGVPGTLMASWQNSLPAEDIAALVTLVTRWDEVPAGAVPAPDTPVAVTAESLALGQELYTLNCSRCHGPEGQGTQRAPALNVQSFFTDKTDAAIQQIVTLGVPSTAMPAWGDRLTDAEIQAIVGFLRQWEASAPAVATPVRGAWWRTGTATGTGAQMPGGGINTGQTGQGQTAPPWAQQNANRPWYSALDWRAWLIIAAVIASGAGLTLLGGVQIARLNKPSPPAA